MLELSTILDIFGSRCGNTGKGTAWLDKEIWHAWLREVRAYWKRARQRFSAYAEAQLVILADGVKTHAVDEEMEQSLENEGICVHIKAAYLTSEFFFISLCL